MYLFIIPNLENKIYTHCQCLSTSHTTHAIFSWLYSWLQGGAAIPREVIVDCSSALLNAISLAFNGFYYKVYLEKCFNVVNGEVETLPRCLIKRDTAHLIKNFCKLKHFENENWVKKDFYVRCIGFCLHFNDIKILEDTISSLFIVCESEYSNEYTECDKRKKSLLEKISTFEFHAHYNSDKSEDDKNTSHETKEVYSYYLNL